MLAAQHGFGRAVCPDMALGGEASSRGGSRYRIAHSSSSQEFRSSKSYINSQFQKTSHLIEYWKQEMRSMNARQNLHQDVMSA